MSKLMDEVYSKRKGEALIERLTKGEATITEDDENYGADSAEMQWHWPATTVRFAYPAQMSGSRTKIIKHAHLLRSIPFSITDSGLLNGMLKGQDVLNNNGIARGIAYGT